MLLFPLNLNKNAYRPNENLIVVLAPTFNALIGEEQERNALNEKGKYKHYGRVWDGAHNPDTMTITSRSNSETPQNQLSRIQRMAGSGFESGG